MDRRQALKTLGASFGALLLSACGGAAAPPSSSAAKPSAGATAAASASPKPAASPSVPASGGLQKVRAGLLLSTSDAGFYIADAKGFFKEQGIEMEVTRFQSAADMTGPLGANQIDVGGVAPGVALINAILRGVDIRVVADKARVSPGHGYEAMLLRKDLKDSGAVKGPADLKGRKWSFASLTGTTPEVLFNLYMQQAGLHARDADLQAIGFPEMAAAFANKAIDGASVIEPFVTQIVSKGDAVILMREDQLAPNHQIAVVMYSPGFPKDHPDLAVKFMVAYVKALRYYIDAFDGKASDKRAEVVDLLVKNTSVKDRALYDKMVLPGFDPNGDVNVASLKQDQDYDISTGLQKQAADIDKVVDLSFVQAAVKQLGPYKPA